jgi:hypothetical protein
MKGQRDFPEFQKWPGAFSFCGFKPQKEKGFQIENLRFEKKF